ncbi:hypothetical protein GCM10009776_26620 [Microbacterium deminutum]|uniref:Uncharacterized protein n=2 Tax=Microbacterium deminutum TaxID=344164 RepID=A0ABN2R383_9MICO
MVRRPEGCRARTLVAEQPHTQPQSTACEESEIVGLQVLTGAEATLEVGGVGERGTPELPLAGVLPSQPPHPGPETRRPPAIAAEPDATVRWTQPVPVAHRGVVGKAVAELRDVAPDGRHHRSDRGVGRDGPDARNGRDSWHDGPPSGFRTLAIDFVQDEPFSFLYDCL